VISLTNFVTDPATWLKETVSTKSKAFEQLRFLAERKLISVPLLVLSQDRGQRIGQFDHIRVYGTPKAFVRGQLWLQVGTE
jgi:hypothetical protein